MQDWGGPTECYPAGGIRPLSHHTELVYQRLADWAPVPSRDSLPIPATPSQATPGCVKLQNRSCRVSFGQDFTTAH